MPWRTNNPERANNEAMSIVNTTKYCARVILVFLPHEQDEEQYALLADGDTKWMPTGKTCLECGCVKSPHDMLTDTTCEQCFEKVFP